MASIESRHALGSKKEASSPPEESSFDKLKRLVDLIKVKIAEGDMTSTDLMLATKEVIHVDLSDERDNCDEIFKDVTGITHSLLDYGHYPAALFMVSVGGKICETFSDPNIKIIRLSDCGQFAHIMVERICLANKNCEIGGYGLRLMQQLCNRTKAVDTDSILLKAHFLCKILSQIGTCYLCINNFEHAAKYFSEALETNTNMFGQRAKEFAITGACCYQVGECYRFMQKFDKAAELFERSIEMYEGALDVEEEEKRKCINLSQDKLRKLCARDFLG
ncbi:unnamed protein product [Clavelina lepadiformis]|uniref:Uncharacterized protein n=1 Tax=Clavelina lepadiformis TaxID=159417 RepID=A0ABP0GA18_CLALP